MSQADRYPGQSSSINQLKCNHFIFIVILFLTLSGGLKADSWQAADEDAGLTQRSGLLLLREGVDASYAAALQMDATMQVSVNGPVARVTFQQTFQNNSDSWMEGRYVFPLPEKAAVDGFSIQVGERLIAGELKERKLAEATFKAARDSGQRAALLSQHRDNLFSTEISNIDPGAAITVNISYLETIEMQDGQFEIQLPLTLTPRYIPGTAVLPKEALSSQVVSGWSSATTEVPDAAWITPSQTRHSASAAARVNLSVRINMGVELGEISSRYHDIDVTPDEGVYTVNFGGDPVPMDRDVVLAWRPVASAEARAALFEEIVGDERFGLLMMMPPSLQTDQPPLSRELVLVIDTSGSMAGESIRQAKRALLLALNRLNPDDRFNVIQFNSYTQTLFGEPVNANRQNVELARTYVSRLNAEGGTEIGPALALALDHEASSGHLKQIVFITDGAVGNEEALLGRIRRNLKAQRLFTVGIGSAPNRYFMRKSAEAGRGVFVSIGDLAEVSNVMNRLFKKLEHPALTSIEVGWSADAVIFPTFVTDLYAGEPVVSLARYRYFQERIEVRGQAGATRWSTNASLHRVMPASGIATLWARRKIESLTDSLRTGADQEQTIQDITRVALAHRISSRYTSFVAVDKTPARSREAALRAGAIDNLMPSGSAQAIPLPATATGLWWHILLAVSFALVGVWLRAMSFQRSAQA